MKSPQISNIGLSQNLLEISVLGLLPTPTELETLGVSPRIFVLISPPGDSDPCSSLVTTALDYRVENCLVSLRTLKLYPSQGEEEPNSKCYFTR